MQRAVELAGRLQIAPERLLEHHARAGRRPRGSQSLHDVTEAARRNGQVVEGMRGRAHGLSNATIRFRIAVLARGVSQPVGQ